MAKNTPVTLGEHFEKTIDKSIRSGRCFSARKGLRLVDEREQKIRILRKAIEAGQLSGFIKNFGPVKDLEKLNEKF